MLQDGTHTYGARVEELHFSDMLQRLSVVLSIHQARVLGTT